MSIHKLHFRTIQVVYYVKVAFEAITLDFLKMFHQITLVRYEDD